MILYPAIDLKDGKCVRLVRGDMDKATVFNDSPAEQAKAFWDAGCKWLHIVDLDGAFEGWPVNSEAVEIYFEALPQNENTAWRWDSQYGARLNTG